MKCTLVPMRINAPDWPDVAIEACASIGARMTITFPCTQCGKQYKAQPGYAGKQMKCQQCGAVFRIPMPRNQTAAASPPSHETWHTEGELVQQDPTDVIDARSIPGHLASVAGGETNPYSAPTSAVPARQFKKKVSSRWGAFGEFLRGPGLWISNGVLGVIVVLLLIALAVTQPAPMGQLATLGVWSGIVAVFVGMLAVCALVLCGVCPMLDMEPPSFGRLFGLLLWVYEVHSVISEVVNLALGRDPQQQFEFGRFAIGLAISVVINGILSLIVLTAALEVSFGKALILWLIKMAVVAAMFIVLGCILFVVLLILGMSVGRQLG